MAQERVKSTISKKKIIQKKKNTKRSSSYTKQRRGLSSSYIFNLPSAQKLKSKAQSLPHVPPSTDPAQPPTRPPPSGALYGIFSLRIPDPPRDETRGLRRRAGRPGTPWNGVCGCSALHDCTILTILTKTNAFKLLRGRASYSRLREQRKEGR